MKYSLTVKHIEINEYEKNMIEEKLKRFRKYLSYPFRFDVVLKGDTHHHSGDIVNCRIKLSHKGEILHAERSKDTIQNTVDECLEAIRKELRKQKGKQRKLMFRLGSIFSKK